jgi:hypothetical protein
MTNEQREELRRNIVSGKFESWLVGKFESWLVVRARIVLDKKPTEGFGRWKGNLIV